MSACEEIFEVYNFLGLTSIIIGNFELLLVENIISDNLKLSGSFFGV